MSEHDPATFHRPATAHELGIMRGFPPPPDMRPTLANWDKPPFNRWSFQNMRNLMPTTPVRRDEGAARPLARAEQDLSDLVFQSSSGRTTKISRWLAESYTDGFLVLHRGRIVQEHYCNGMTPDTLHLSQSVAKSVVGVLAGVLHGRGLIDLAAPVTALIPELSHSGYAGATVEHVLDMTSGVRFSEDYDSPGSDMGRIDVASGWRPPEPGNPMPTIRDVILTLPLALEHGVAFEYRSVEADVLAWLLERAAGAPLAELLSRHIWRPIGAEHDGYYTLDSAGTAQADGGFNATLRDYGRFAQLCLDGGTVDDREVVPADWLEGSRSGRHDLFTALHGQPFSPVSPNGAYSRQWWIHDVARGDHMARGVFGQMIFIDPAARLVAVKLSSWPEYLNAECAIDAVLAAQAIGRELA